MFEVIVIFFVYRELRKRCLAINLGEFHYDTLLTICWIGGEITGAFLVALVLDCWARLSGWNLWKSDIPLLLMYAGGVVTSIIFISLLFRRVDRLQFEYFRQPIPWTCHFCAEIVSAELSRCPMCGSERRLTSQFSNISADAPPAPGDFSFLDQAQS